MSTLFQRSSTFWLAASVAASALTFGGCATSGMTSPVSPELRALWGTTGSRVPAGVSFAYRVRFADGEEISLTEVALRFDEFEHLWVRSSPGDSLTCVTLAGGPGGMASQLALGSETREAGLDFALRSIRLFFSVPLTTSRGPWEYRSLLRPSLAWGEPQLEVVFRGAFDPHGACFLELDPSRRAPRRIVYAGRHPFVQAMPAYATFSEYAEIEGVPIAARRTHHEMSPPPSPRDPFPELGRPRDPMFLEETVRAVRFLSAVEVGRLLPIPEASPEDGSTEGVDAAKDLSPVTLPATAAPTAP
jgi:hypothetical protein